MPFVKVIDREKMDKMIPHTWLFNDSKRDVVVGDRCYYFYKKMIKTWNDNPRWTTAHNIYKLMVKEIKTLNYSEDTKIAYDLAWQVFFARIVLKYEKDKAKENGDIT